MFGFKGQNTTAGTFHGLGRIGYQVHKYLLQLVFRTEQIRQVRIQFIVYFDTIDFKQVRV